MDGLRWVLLLAGALVIAAVYVYSRRDRSEADKPSAGLPDEEELPSASRQEPSIGHETSHDAEAAPDSEPIEIGSTEQKIVTLRVVGANKVPFAGDELVLSLRGIGMRHGRFGIFHRYDGNDENLVVFSAASLVEPGSFDLENIKEQQIPGISLFMVLPGPIDGAEAFDQMISAARTLTQSLRAELLDETGSTLSIQRERYLREEIIQFQHSNMVA
jgi:cell division protein ZipA